MRQRSREFPYPSHRSAKDLILCRLDLKAYAKNALTSLEKMHLNVRVRKHIKHFCCGIHLGHFSGVWRVNPRFVSIYYPRPCEIEIFMIPATSEILSFLCNKRLLLGPPSGMKV